MIYDGTRTRHTLGFGCVAPNEWHAGGRLLDERARSLAHGTYPQYTPPQAVPEGFSEGGGGGAWRSDLDLTCAGMYAGCAWDVRGMRVGMYASFVGFRGISWGRGGISRALWAGGFSSRMRVLTVAFSYTRGPGVIQSVFAPL